MKQKLFSLLGLLFSIALYAQNVSFTPDIDFGCAPLTVNFVNESADNGLDTNGIDFQWSFQDGSDTAGYQITHTFTSPGNYNVALTAYDGGMWIGDYFYQIHVEGSEGMFYPEDSASFCPEEQVSFNYDGQYEIISWDLGDGELRNWNHVEYIFPDPGFYTIRLNLEHSCGIDEIVQVVEISTEATPNPYIQVNQQSVCADDELFFSTQSEGDIFEWNFGDGDFSTDKDPNHAFTSIGEYDVVLDVTNICGNTGSDTSTIHVGEGIEFDAWFNINGSTCPNVAIPFYTHLSGTYEWDFGNGQYGFNNEEHVYYADTGWYEVELVITNGCAFSDTAHEYIQIQYDTTYKPWVSIGLDNSGAELDTIMVCPGTDVVLQNRSEMWEVNYVWIFDDGDSLFSNQNEVSHVYMNPGIYKVLLTGTTPCGGKNTDSKWIIVSDTLTPSPTLSLLPQMICPGEYVYFFDGGENESINQSYSLWFGDGESLLDVGPVNDSIVPVTARHQYNNLGWYEFTFSTTNTCGNTYSLTDTIWVSDTLSSGFYYVDNDTQEEYPSCPGDAINFYAVGGLSVSWDFGDGNLVEGNVVSHAFDEVGEHIAMAIFTTGCGAIDTVETIAYVGLGNYPYDYFSYHPSGLICAGDTVFFEYDGWDGGDNFNYRWYFGDGDSSDIRSPYHIYNLDGQYEVEFSVTNGCGTSSRSDQLQVRGILIDETGLTTTDPTCGVEDGMIEGLTTLGDMLDYVEWQNANGDPIGADLNISGLSPGNYSLMVESVLGCADWGGPYELVNPGAPIAPLAESPEPYCEGETVSDLSASASAGGTLTWFADAALTMEIGIGSSLTPGADSSANYYVTETSGNCQSPATKVSVAINLVYEYVDSIEICSNDSVYLEGAWQNTSGIYTDSWLTVSSCDSMITTHLVVYPAYDLMQTTYICIGDSVFLDGAWQKESGTYVDEMLSIEGCDSIITTDLHVGELHLIPTSESICEGDSVFFGGEWLKETGLFYDTLVSGTSCDSIVELSLMVNQNYMLVADATLCEGDSVFLAGDWQTEAGNYIDYLTTAHGCDSIITTSVTVVSAVMAGTAMEEICYGDSLLIGAQWRHTEGVYNDTIFIEGVCDSIIAVNLVVHPNVHYNESQTICEGDSAFLGGQWQFTAGMYDDVYETEFGCDSTISTELTVENCGTGMGPRADLSGWAVYPNPTNGTITIQLNEINADKVILYNATGELIKEVVVESTKLEIDLSNLENGIYIFRYNNQTQQIILMKE